MYTELGLQLYSVRNYMTDEAGVKETFRRLHEIGYTEAQTAGMPCDVTAFAKAAKDNGIKIVGTHCAFPEDVDNIDGYVNFHKTLGTTNAGVGGAATEIRTDKAKILEFIEKANRLAENLSKYGMKFTYHHHIWEFARLGGDRIIDLMADGFDKKNISFVLDTYWLQNGGVSVIDWIEKLAGRCDILHLKDYGVKPNDNNGYITELDNGNIDLVSVVKTAEATGVKHLCVEQDYWPEGFDSVDYCMRKSFEYFKNVLSK